MSGRAVRHVREGDIGDVEGAGGRAAGTGTSPFPRQMAFAWRPPRCPQGAVVRMAVLSAGALSARIDAHMVLSAWRAVRTLGGGLRGAGRDAHMGGVGQWMRGAKSGRGRPGWRVMTATGALVPATEESPRFAGGLAGCDNHNFLQCG